MNLRKPEILKESYERQKETLKLVATLESRLTDLKAKRHKLIDAFVYQHSIDRTVYQEQLDLLDDDIALVKIEVPRRDTRGTGY